jgi:hypothetical protein
MTLTAAQIRPFLAESALTDAELQRLVDAAYATITGRIGAAGSRTELLYGGFRTIALGRRATSITSVSEEIGTTSTILAADDYRLRPDGYTLERISTGTNPRWRWWGLVTVVSTPTDDAAIRDEVAIDLCRLAINYNPGLTSETIGTWTEQYASNSVWNNAEERDAILSRLNPSPGMIVVGSARWGSTW